MTEGCRDGTGSQSTHTGVAVITQHHFNAGMKSFLDYLFVTLFGTNIFFYNIFKDVP